MTAKKLFEKNRILILLLVLAVGAAAILYIVFKPKSASVDYGINLLSNGDFEKITGEELPANWLPDAYFSLPGASEFDVTDGFSGKGIRIRNVELNDARFMQTVSVSPNTLYELSGMVLADAREGRGANLSIADVYVDSESYLSTPDGWQQVKVYGRTGPGQRELTVFARLGGYSAESLGEASFDDISLKAIKEAPAGQVVDSWEVWKASPRVEAAIKQAAPAWPWLLLIAVMFGLLAVQFAKRAEAYPQIDSMQSSKLWDMNFLWLLIFALISRIVIAVLVPGYGVDVGCFTGWANRMHEVGPSSFYITEQHSDYPPGYMLVLWPLGLLGSLFGTGASELMIKLPPILADIAALALLYPFIKKYSSKTAALFITAIYAFNPVVFVTGAAWGQADSVPAVLLMAVIILAYQGKWSYALPVYVLSILMKPQALMFGPLGLAALVLYLMKSKDKNKWKHTLIGIGASLAVALAVIMPFSLKQDNAKWLSDLYFGTMTFYDYATVNATNLYFLFGLNWVPISQSAPILLRLIGSISLIAPVSIYLLSYKSSIKKVELFGLMVSLLPAAAVGILPLSLSVTGTLLMVSAFLIILIRFISSGSVHNLPLLGAVMLLVFCCFGVMMHERYVFPAILLLMLAYVQKRDRKILWLMIAVSILTFLNVGIALDRGIRIGGVPGHLTAPNFGIVSESGWLEYLISGLNVLVSAWGLLLGLTHSRSDTPVLRVKALSADQNNIESKSADAVSGKARHRLFHGRHPAKMDFKDWLLMIAITLIFGAVALTNLGATKSPQQPWVSTLEDNQAIFDLGEERSFKLLYFGGIHQRESDFEVGVSDDKLNWSNQMAKLAQPDKMDCFHWQYLSDSVLSSNGDVNYLSDTAVLQGRYLRITALQRLTTLMEIIVRDADTGEDIPLSLVSGKGEALIDEQNTLKGEPSWYNSMYFDEIYHARTAYEHMNAIKGTQPNQTYETSHPPLGKVLMSLSTMVFGMTPFGWRFAGAMAGILMLPGMYWLGKMLTGRRLFGLAAMILLAVDGMHFAQTRIATIDSFVTLFIILSYAFMFRYALDESAHRRFRDDIIYLACSGLFMGLGIASKWTGIYAGIGLAVIFFFAMYRRAATGMAAEQILLEDTMPDEPDKLNIATQTAQNWRWQTIYTLLWCLLLFIAVPAFIYYISFLPWFMRTPGGLTVKKVFDASKSMFNYHASPGLGMDHPFYSPWYAWPLILKPFYFFSGTRIGNTGSTIMSFGNPAVWWGGFAAFLLMVYCRLKQHVSLFPLRFSLISFEKHTDIRPALLIVAYLAQFAPWMLVPRGTYLYHYFPSVPFIILCAVMALYYLWRKHKKVGLLTTIAYLLIALVLFVAFFPYYSGLRVSTDWLNAMRWFPNWIYY
ncbi:MAG: phospholipid carrier-dependent glycosyltransferase [Clostridiales bacterium]|nr:phospholipid carrier-dependent glycosyltransferase [Clostridiales bacterium]